jgi:prepilin peptidase CpaA
MSTNQLVSVSVLVIGVVACVFDVRTRRIPNLLTFGAAIAGLCFHAFVSGASGAILAGSGWLVGLLILIPYFLAGGMGGGDVKLLAALGAWLGPWETFWLAIYAGLAGGVVGLCLALSHRYLWTAISNLRLMVGYWWTVGFRPVPGLTLDSAASPRLAYAIPILLGTVLTLWR